MFGCLTSYLIKESMVFCVTMWVTLILESRGPGLNDKYRQIVYIDDALKWQAKEPQEHG